MIGVQNVLDHHSRFHVQILSPDNEFLGHLLGHVPVGETPQNAVDEIDRDETGNVVRETAFADVMELFGESLFIVIQHQIVDKVRQNLIALRWTIQPSSNPIDGPLESMSLHLQRQHETEQIHLGIHLVFMPTQSVLDGRWQQTPYDHQTRVIAIADAVISHQVPRPLDGHHRVRLKQLRRKALHLLFGHRAIAARVHQMAGADLYQFSCDVRVHSIGQVPQLHIHQIASGFLLHLMGATTELLIP